MTKTRKVIMSVTLVLALLLPACSLGGGNATANEDVQATAAWRVTQAVQTVYVQITQTALAKQLMATPTFTPAPPTATVPPATPTPIITDTPMPTIPSTATPTNTHVPAQSSPHCPLAQVTRSDIDPGSTVSPGQWIIARWTVLNAGDCAWTTDYQVVYWDGETFGLSPLVNFHKSVEPGDFIIITFEFAAPSTPGVYKSWWMMRNTHGEVFGNGPNDVPLYLELNVKQSN